MKPYSILTVDLNQGTTTEQRSKFNEKLAELKWIKFPDVTTLWYSSWKEGTTAESMVRVAKSDVEDAARVAGIY